MHDRTLLIVGAGAAVTLAAIGFFAAKKAGKTIADNANLVNPVSRENLVYRGASAVTEAITGVPGDSPGTWLHRIIRPDLEAYDPTKDTTGRGIFRNSAPFVGDLPTVFDPPASSSLPTWSTPPYVPQPGLWDPANPFAWGA